MVAFQAITILCLSMYLGFLVKTAESQASFPCTTLAPSATIPTSVHELRPGDIKVVAALGDSLTAGRGAGGGLLAMFFDYRGLAWSIGGQDSYSKLATLPNILRMYNPNLRGYSEGVGNRKARFNVGKSMATSSDSLRQANVLVQRMRADSGVNMADDWKVITIFFGANDLCNSCQDETQYTTAMYKANLRLTLDYLKANVPRAFVNLVEMMQVDRVAELAKNRPLCRVAQAVFCDCAVKPKTPEAKARLIKLREDYQTAALELAASTRYNTSDDFAVVLQSFYRNTTVPTEPNGQPDNSYFASDCFHFSKKGHVTAGEALWNNMVEPVGSKRTTWTHGETIKCPTQDHPFLYTAKNSNKNEGI